MEETAPLYPPGRLEEDRSQCGSSILSESFAPVATVNLRIYKGSSLIWMGNTGLWKVAQAQLCQQPSTPDGSFSRTQLEQEFGVLGS